MTKTIADRIQLLGGVSLAMAHEVAEPSLIPRAPKGREEVPVQIWFVAEHGIDVPLTHAM
jgi:starvation-inducible DNA-binding protein